MCYISGYQNYFWGEESIERERERERRERHTAEREVPSGFLYLEAQLQTKLRNDM